MVNLENRKSVRMFKLTIGDKVGTGMKSVSMSELQNLHKTKYK